MANNSAKKNEKSMKSTVIYVQVIVFGLILWFMGFNTAYLLQESISIWSYLICTVISALSYGCYKQILRCWELQLPPEAAEYYIDVLAVNCIVHLIDPFTTKIWNIYWLFAVFLGWQGVKWLWSYITPKYEPTDEEDDEQGSKKKEKKQKKQKVKYIK